MHLMFLLLCGVVATVCMVLTLPLVLELFVLSAAAVGVLARRQLQGKGISSFAVIVPAHNEGKLIAQCVASLIACGDAHTTVYVIAHNCSDQTAQIAAEAGAVVLPLQDDGSKGKGAALFYGFEQALQRGAHAVMVIDADSVVSPDLLAQARHAFAAGADAVQCRYVVANAEDTDRTRLLALSFLGINVLRPRGRARLGLSCGIFGNGFALSADTLRAIPYVAHSVVEDLEYHLMLVRAGRRVQFLDTVQVFGEMPDNSAAASTQRARWEGGRARMRKQFAPYLLGQVLRGHIALLEPLLDLLTMPIANGVLVLLVSLCVPLLWSRVYGVLGLASIALYILVSASLSSNPWATLRALASVPKHLLTKILLIPATRRAAHAQAAWVRTKRNVEKS